MKKAENTLQQQLMTVSLESEGFRKRINELEEEFSSYKRTSCSQTTDEMTQTEDSVSESVDELELSSVKVLVVLLKMFHFDIF